MKKLFRQIGIIAITAVIIFTVTTCEINSRGSVSKPQELADEFSAVFSDILELTVDTVTASDETAINEALAAFEELADDVKFLLIAEKKLLDDLKDKIEELKKDNDPNEGNIDPKDDSVNDPVKEPIANNNEVVSTVITVIAPVKGAVPNTTATVPDGSNYTVSAVTWNPADNPFLGGVVYTATVTLTAKEGYTFANTITATINGHSAVISDKTSKAITIAYAFGQTSTKTVTNITIETQPAKLNYIHGETLNLSGLAVKLVYDDGSIPTTVAYENFANYSELSVSPANGIVLVHSTHNGQKITVNYGALSVDTSALTVGKALLTYTADNKTTTYNTAAPAFTYIATGFVNSETEATAVTGAPSFASAYTVGNTVNTYTITISQGTLASDDYDFTFINGILTVNKANPVVTWPSGLQAYTGQVLSDINLTGKGSSTPAGTFTWTTPGNSVGEAGTRSHSMTFTPDDTDNYNFSNVTGWNGTDKVVREVSINVVVQTYTVTFNSNGTVYHTVSNILYDSEINFPATPSNSTLVFKGWYKEQALTNKWNFTFDTVTDDITLYAKWETYNGGYSVGSTGPGGGKIYYKDENGFVMADTGEICHYLEAAPSNSSTSISWTPTAGILIIDRVTTFATIDDGKASEIGNGRRDTQLIVAYLEANKRTGSAAQLCVAETFGGQKDWFLPSLGELDLYYQSTLTTEKPTNGYFWSSSQLLYGGSTYGAWRQSFEDGSRHGVLRNNLHNVRAVRAF